MPNPFLPMTPLEEAISGENSRFQVKTATQTATSSQGPLPPVARPQSLQAKAGQRVHR